MITGAISTMVFAGKSIVQYIARPFEGIFPICNP
jgi:hypothetical protein